MAGQPFNPRELFRGVFVPSAILRCKDLSLTSKIVYACLAQHANENGEFFPNTETIADEVGSTKPTIIKAIKQLEEKGFIKVVRPNERNKPNSYQFLWHPTFDSVNPQLRNFTTDEDSRLKNFTTDENSRLKNLTTPWLKNFTTEQPRGKETLLQQAKGEIDESSKINGFNESAGGQSGNVDVSGDLNNKDLDLHDLNNKDLDLHDLHVIPLDPDQELIKNNILSSRTKRKPKIYTEDNTYYKMAKYFYDRVTAVARELGLEHLTIKANLQSWADDMRKMVEIDGVDKRLAKEVMDWVTTDPFWQRNVLSAKKLREKFSELAIKMRADKQAQKHKVVPINRRKEKDEERIDKEIAWRNKEIAFQKWVMAGNDPNAFDWS